MIGTVFILRVMPLVKCALDVKLSTIFTQFSGGTPQFIQKPPKHDIFVKSTF